MNRRAGAAFAVGVAALLLSSDAFAQTYPPPIQSPRKEGFSIGVLLTAQLGVGRFVSLRVGVPASRKAGFDFDIGYRLKRRPKGAWDPMRGRGWIAAAHVRWLPRGRLDTGWGTSLNFGVRLFQAHAADANGAPRTAVLLGLDLLGLGIDRVLADGQRVGFEGGHCAIAGSIFGPRDALPGWAGEGMGPYISGYGLWRRQ